MLRRAAMIAAAILSALAAHAQAAPDQPRPGAVYELRRVVDSSTASRDEMGPTGSSHDEDRIVERVIAVREAGTELEYDLPNDASADDRAREWKFPARLVRPPHGPAQLLNAPELERRLERWLTSAGLPREACGRWYFSWNAFQIDCDPQAVILLLEPFTLWPDELRDGAPWQQRGSRAPVPLRQERPAPGRETFVARMEIDPEAVRSERVRADLVVAEIMHRGLTPEAALQAHAGDRISGTMVTTFEVDAPRHIRRRTTVTELDVRSPDGRTEHRTVTETVDRRLVRAAPTGA